MAQKPPPKKPGEKPVEKKRERKKEGMGHVVYCGKRSYQVESLLGSGGFGDVYKVRSRDDKGECYAMKTERFDMATTDLMRRLRIEITIYDKFRTDAEKGIDTSHFAKMLDYGRSDEYKFMIMEMVGPSLADIRAKLNLVKMSPHTIAMIARQTLIPIQALHESGWIHRDLKPQNFTIGAAGKESTIYLLDFGIARAFRDDEGKIKAPRKKAPWVGTLKYTSIRGHRDEEQTRRDDIESWCYMILEFYYKQNLTWFSKEVSHLIEHKTRVMTAWKGNRAMDHLLMPNQFYDILKMTNLLTFTGAPDYAGMHKLLQDIVMREKIDMTRRLDWIGKTIPAGPESQLKEESRRESQGSVGVKDLSHQRDSVSKGRDDDDDSDNSETDEDKRRRRKKRRSVERDSRDETEAKRKKQEKKEKRRKRDAKKGMKEKKLDIAYQLDYIVTDLEDSDFKETSVAYQKFADEMHNVKDEIVIDRVWKALKNPIIYLMDDDGDALQELRTIMKSVPDEAKSSRTKARKKKKDDARMRLRYIAYILYKKHYYDACEDYVALAEDVEAIKDDAVLDKLLNALSLSTRRYIEDRNDKRYNKLRDIIAHKEAIDDDDIDRKKLSEKQFKKDKESRQEKMKKSPGKVSAKEKDTVGSNKKMKEKGNDKEKLSKRAVEKKAEVVNDGGKNKMNKSPAKDEKVVEDKKKKEEKKPTEAKKNEKPSPVTPKTPITAHAGDVRSKRVAAVNQKK